MKIPTALGLLLLSTTALASGVGEPCATNKDCDSHICLDLAATKDTCKGIKVCATACNEKTNNVCTRALPDGKTEKGDCDPVKMNGKRKDYCLYRSFLALCHHEDRN